MFLENDNSLQQAKLDELEKRIMFLSKSLEKTKQTISEFASATQVKAMQETLDEFQNHYASIASLDQLKTDTLQNIAFLQQQVEQVANLLPSLLEIEMQCDLLAQDVLLLQTNLQHIAQLQMPRQEVEDRLMETQILVQTSLSEAFERIPQITIARWS